MRDTGKVYVLAVGIEEYHHTVKRNPLPGCRKDVVTFLQYLRNHFGESRLVIRELLDYEATRENMIASFLGEKDIFGRPKPPFFAEATKDDTFIFYYSGHGSTVKADPIFGLTNSQHETLLCYDSRKAGMHDLADKELNYLISKVTSQVNNTVVIVDSCHSDSVMRDESKWHERHEPSDADLPRPLDTYLSGVIQDSRDIQRLPGTNFITLSACAYNESAYGSTQGGAFTQNLLSVLSGIPGDMELPSYHELFYQIKAKIGNDRVPQHPQIGCWGEVNPHWRFLTRELASRQQMPIVYWEKENASWYVNAGAFHGYRAEEVKNQIIPIYARGEEDKAPLYRAQITQLGVDKSKLSFLEGIPHESAVVLVAGISRPLFRVNLVNPDTHLENLLNTPSYNFLHDPEAEISIEVKEDTYRIEQKGKQPALIHGFKGLGEEGATYILNHVQSIADWYFTADLKSPQNSSIQQDQLSFSLSFEGMVREKDQTFNSAEVQKFEVPHSGEEVPFTLTIKNDTAYDLYYALLHIDRKFNIDVWNEGGQTVLLSGKEIEEPASFFIEEDIQNKVLLARTLLDIQQEGRQPKEADYHEGVQDEFLLIASKQSLHVGAFRRLPFSEESGKWESIFDPAAPHRGARKGVIRGKRDVGSNWLVKRIQVISYRKKA